MSSIGSAAAAATLATREAVIAQMLIACDVVADEASDAPALGAMARRLNRTMRRAAGGARGFVGDDRFKPFRELAWSAASRLYAAPDIQTAQRWGRILREILTELPEYAATTN